MTTAPGKMTPTRGLRLFSFLLLLLTFGVNNFVTAFPRAHGGGAYTDIYRRVHFTRDIAGEPQCRQPTSPFDFSAKLRRHQELPICDQTEGHVEVPVETRDVLASVPERHLLPRAPIIEDYTCAADRPCSNSMFSLL